MCVCASHEVLLKVFCFSCLFSPQRGRPSSANSQLNISTAGKRRYDRSACRLQSLPFLVIIYYCFVAVVF